MKKYLLPIISLLLSAVAAYASAPESVSITPAEGDVQLLETFELRFDGEWGLGSKRSAKITISGPEGVQLPAIYNYSAGTHYIIYFEDDAIVDTPGEYTLNIPAGKFAIDGEDLPDMSFNYTIVESEQGEFPEYTLDPAEGAVESLSVFTLTFDTDQTITVTEGAARLDGPDGTSAISAAVDGNVVTLTVVDAYNAPLTITGRGAYRLILPAGAIRVGVTPNETPIVADYTIGGQSSWTGEVEATPADGSELEELTEVNIVFVGAESVSTSDSVGPRDFPKLYNDATGAEASSCFIFPSGNALSISLNTPPTAPGAYTLRIPAAFITVDGQKPDEPIELHYTIVGEEEAIEYTYAFTPDEGSAIGPNGTVTITFSGDGLTLVENDPYTWGNGAPHFTNTDGNYNPSLRIEADDDVTFTFTHDWPFEAEGSYTLVIPAGYFTLTYADGSKGANTLIEAPFTVTLSGIDTITPNADSAPNASAAPAFDLQGRPVTTPAPGTIIIASGQKCLVK